MTDYQNILEDLKTSMISKDELKTSTLRMLKAELMKYEKENLGNIVTEELIDRTIRKLVKQRVDSASQYKSAGRNDLAEKEEMEIEILKAYLPTELSDDEILTVIRSSMLELGVSDKSGIGKLIGSVMSKLNGRVDGARVKDLVERELN